MAGRWRKIIALCKPAAVTGVDFSGLSITDPIRPYRFTPSLDTAKRCAFLPDHHPSLLPSLFNTTTQGLSRETFRFLLTKGAVANMITNGSQVSASETTAAGGAQPAGTATNQPIPPSKIMSNDFANFVSQFKEENIITTDGTFSKVNSLIGGGAVLWHKNSRVSVKEIGDATNGTSSEEAEIFGISLALRLVTADNLDGASTVILCDNKDVVKAFQSGDTKTLNPAVYGYFQIVYADFAKAKVSIDWMKKIVNKRAHKVARNALERKKKQLP